MRTAAKHYVVACTGQTRRHNLSTLSGAFFRAVQLCVEASLALVGRPPIHKRAQAASQPHAMECCTCDVVLTTSIATTSSSWDAQAKRVLNNLAISPSTPASH
eukprot:4433404-Amphidinium_carterae.2